MTAQNVPYSLEICGPYSLDIYVPYLLDTYVPYSLDSGQDPKAVYFSEVNSFIYVLRDLKIDNSA